METQDWKTQTRKNVKNLAVWTMAWTLSMALATFGPTVIWGSNTTLTAIGILLNVLIGVGMILANIRHLKGLDDLQKKIHLDAMGIALGVGVVGGLSYSLLDTTNLISQDAEISHLVILIGLTYLFSALIGQKRFS